MSVAAAIVSIAALSVACVLSAAAWAGPADEVQAGPRPAAVPSGRPDLPPGRPDSPAGRPDLDLSPAALPPVPDPGLGTAAPRPVRPAARDLRPIDHRTATKKTAPTDDRDDDLPARPGAFTPAPTKLPSPLHKQRVIAPHTSSPDLEMDLSKRSSVGVFGEVGRISREDIRTSTVKEGRDLGAGVTWQYKFDSR